MTIILQADKGVELLTPAEADENIRHLRDGDTVNYPKAKGFSVKVGSESPGSETTSWEDLFPLGGIQVFGDAGDATRQPYVDGIKALQFTAVNHSAFCDFHLPHDYWPGSDILIHAHWSVNNALITGGSVTWGFEHLYAKGHNQQAFGAASKTESVVQSASTTPRQHMIAETQLSFPTGSATQIPTEDLETDGVIQVRIHLISNDITVSGGAVPDPFIHTVDLHYQSTGIGTKNKAPTPDFWT